MSSENNSDFTGEDRDFPKSKLAFDFKVYERPIYRPNSGPPLQPISLIPPHDLKGIILDCFPYPKPKDPSHFLVGYEKEPHNQLIIHPDNIRDYVSEYTLENWEHERSTAEENRAIEELQPRLIAAERARVLRELKKAGLSRDVLKGEYAEQYQAIGIPKKRGRPPKSMASVFKPIPKLAPHVPGEKRRPGRPRKVVEVHVNSPTTSHHRQPSLSQPSLSQPFSTASRAMLEHAFANSGSEEEEDDADLVLDQQLNEEANQESTSIMNSSTAASSPVMKASGHGKMNKTPVQSPQKNKSFQKSPHNRSQRAPILPGMSVNAYPYKDSNIDAYNENNSKGVEGSPIMHNRSPSSLQHLPILSAENCKQPIYRTSQRKGQGAQSKIVDYFDDSDTQIHTPEKVEANQYHQSASSLKRKSSPSLEQERGSSGKSRIKSRRLHKDAYDYLDADYKEPSKKGVQAAMNYRASSSDLSPSARRGSDSFNLRSSRSRSQRLGSSPEAELDAEDERRSEDESKERDSEKAFEDEPPVWSVKSILDHKYEWNENHDKQELWYFVDWEGDWDPSWEPAKLVSDGAIDEYIASRRANGLGNLSISINAMDIRGNDGEVSQGNDLEHSIENDIYL
ncbi:5c03a987-74df-4971-bfd6-5be6b35cfb23-CDS [Sclerotinia trifoliorum]|uniref:5c03a987-74df-4971-bfd6-5be6b35cfb23-CDS n=1 Tax=Sclerotinia trifoliorum TaxID=28548 RepID=A0A8H2VNM0_9HELO|nr:5c03a987-74df-4971-bfd6-5be6b35cfb23-CDS [Sclerotinia trifoliorum]